MKSDGVRRGARRAWSFAFWIGQVAAMAGLLAFMLQKP
jgi:hypothetical protein